MHLVCSTPFLCWLLPPLLLPLWRARKSRTGNNSFGNWCQRMNPTPKHIFFCFRYLVKLILSSIQWSAIVHLQKMTSAVIACRSIMIRTKEVYILNIFLLLRHTIWCRGKRNSWVLQTTKTYLWFLMSIVISPHWKCILFFFVTKVFSLPRACGSSTFVSQSLKKSLFGKKFEDDFQKTELRHLLSALSLYTGDL